MRSFLRFVPAIVVSFAAAAALRYGLVEPEALVHSCGTSAALWWCVPRAAVIASFASGGLAIAAVAAAIMATFNRSPRWGLAAACLGVGGLVLYSYEAGAAAFLLGLLVLARGPAARAAVTSGGARSEA